MADWEQLKHPRGVDDKFGPHDGSKPATQAKKSKALLYPTMRTPAATDTANNAASNQNDSGDSNANKNGQTDAAQVNSKGVDLSIIEKAKQSAEMKAWDQSDNLM